MEKALLIVFIGVVSLLFIRYVWARLRPRMAAASGTLIVGVVLGCLVVLAIQAQQAGMLGIRISEGLRVLGVR
jgi:glucan phosphoethanolaminetransferase (alkaline phosphatase superfamily)